MSHLPPCIANTICGVLATAPLATLKRSFVTGARSQQPTAFEKSKMFHAILSSTFCLSTTSLVQTPVHSLHAACTHVNSKLATLRSLTAAIRIFFKTKRAKFLTRCLRGRCQWTDELGYIAYKHLCKSNKPGFVLRKGVLSEWRHKRVKAMVIDKHVYGVSHS